MDIFLQILFSGLAVGSMYAVGAIALSLLWGTMGMLNIERHEEIGSLVIG